MEPLAILSTFLFTVALAEAWFLWDKNDLIRHLTRELANANKWKGVWQGRAESRGWNRLTDEERKDLAA